MKENEKVLFKVSNTVTITDYRAVVGTATYPIANITSVCTFEETLGAWKFLIGLFSFVIGGGIITNDSSIGWVFLFSGILLMLWWYLKPKHKYWVRIGTAGTECNAFASEDKTLVDQVVSALNDAIVARG